MKIDNIINYRDIIHQEYEYYKTDIQTKYKNFNNLLNDYITFPLLKAFNVLIVSDSKQKLFYPSYYQEFESNYIKYNKIFKSKYDNLLNLDVDLSDYFQKTLEILNKIPNVTQVSIVEIKPNANFVPHTHEPQTVYILDISDNDGGYLEIKVEDDIYKFNKNNPFLCFDGSKLHQATEYGNTNRVYILICCK